MTDDSRILIVGSTPGAQVCERLIKPLYEAKRLPADRLDTTDFEWCSFVLTLSNDIRREIARTHPDPYLSRRVISLNIPEERAENRIALKQMIAEQLENHGLYVR